MSTNQDQASRLLSSQMLSSEIPASKLLQLDDIQTLGSRIKSLRVYCDLSRPKFCKRHTINFPTLRSWEWNISTVSGRLLDRLLGAFRAEGITVDSTWLLTGVGTAPTLITTNQQHLLQGRHSKDSHNYHSVIDHHEPHDDHPILQSDYRYSGDPARIQASIEAILRQLHLMLGQADYRTDQIKAEIEVFLIGNPTAQVIVAHQNYPSLNLRPGDLVGGIKIDIHDPGHYQSSDRINRQDQNDINDIPDDTYVSSHDKSYSQSLAIGQSIVVLVQSDQLNSVSPINQTDQKIQQSQQQGQEKNQKHVMASALSALKQKLIHKAHHKTNKESQEHQEIQQQTADTATRIKNDFELYHAQKLSATHVILAPLGTPPATWHYHTYPISTVIEAIELYQVCWLRCL